MLEDLGRGWKRSDGNLGLTGILLTKPIPNRRLKICELLEALVAENNLHRGRMANVKSINLSRSTKLSTMLASASVVHGETVTDGRFEASAAI